MSDFGVHDTHEADDDDTIHNDPVLKDRAADLSKSKKLQEKALKIFSAIRKGFDNMRTRVETIDSAWDVYNCVYDGAKQSYRSTHSNPATLPVTRVGVDARVTRYTNQLFPNSSRHVDVVSSDGTVPYGLLSLLEHYIDKSKLRELIPAMIRNGDTEGQYNVYVDWEETKRTVVRKVKAPLDIKLEDGMEVSDANDRIETIEEEEICDGGPRVELLCDADVLVIPSTAPSLEAAIQDGGSVTITRQWSREKISQMADDGEIDSKAAKEVMETLDGAGQPQTFNKSVSVLGAMGIRGSGRGSFAKIYETWTYLKLPEGRRLCRIYFVGSAGDNAASTILSIKRNPFWSDRLPIISAPVTRVHGSFKGQSKVGAVCDIQYIINDILNLALDSLTYTICPVVLTDPERNPNIGSLVIAPGAVWPVSPDSTQVLQFPSSFQSALESIGILQQVLMQMLTVNTSQVTQATKKKMNQAEVANEQQIDILTTSDVVSVVEASIMTPIIQRFLELDHQFRDKDITVRGFGELGVKMNMQVVEPIQLDTRYSFKWCGVESVRSAQRMQQGIALLNVLKGIPPQQLMPYKVNFAPFIAYAVENGFDPRVANMTLTDTRDAMSTDPERENHMISDGHIINAHPLDDHLQHIMSHKAYLDIFGTGHDEQSERIRGALQQHMMEHNIALMASMQGEVQKQGGLPGAPGGAGPGVAGTPRPGAQPGMPRGGQQPPGMVQQDQLQDPSMMPRNM